MRRRFPVTPLILLALSLLIVVSAVAVAVTLGGESDVDEAAVASVTTQAPPALFTTSASSCTTPSQPVPHTGCIREGQCCECPCEALGTCSTFQGDLVCLCPCAQ